MLSAPAGSPTAVRSRLALNRVKPDRSRVRSSVAREVMEERRREKEMKENEGERRKTNQSEENGTNLVQKTTQVFSLHKASKIYSAGTIRVSSSK